MFLLFQHFWGRVMMGENDDGTYGTYGTGREIKNYELRIKSGFLGFFPFGWRAAFFVFKSLHEMAL